MAGAPTPEEVYQRASEEGARRLDMPLLEQLATGFIAGVTIIFGIVALGVTEALVEPRGGRELARLFGAFGFGIGLVFLVVGRSELFSENLFGPVAAAIDRADSTSWFGLLQLWGSTLLFNLLGGGLLVAVLTVEGALPEASSEALVRVARESADKAVLATLTRAVLAGALIALLSYMLAAADSVAARILVAYAVAVFLALGPFDHVVVTTLHLLFGIWSDGGVGYADLGTTLVVSTIGNLVGGVLLVTLSHTAQAKTG